MVTKGIFVCKNLKSLLIFHQYCISFLQVSPWIELHPSGLSIISYIFLLIFFLCLNTLVPMKSSSTDLCDLALGVWITLAKVVLMISRCFEMLVCTLKHGGSPKPTRCAHSDAAVSCKHVTDQISIKQCSSKMTQDTAKPRRTRWGRFPWGKWKGGQSCTWAVLEVQSSGTDWACSRGGQCLSWSCLAPRWANTGNWHLSHANPSDGLECLV